MDKTAKPLEMKGNRYLRIELDLPQEELSCMRAQDAKEEEERKKKAIKTRQKRGQVDIKSPLL
jgi:hypothetical protein